MQMEDPIHQETFNHNCSRELQVNAAKFQHVQAQHVDFFLVLDLEGKVEILEFPVLMIDAKTMDVVDLFHRFYFLSSMACSKWLNLIIPFVIKYLKFPFSIYSFWEPNSCIELYPL